MAETAAVEPSQVDASAASQVDTDATPSPVDVAEILTRLEKTEKELRLSRREAQNLRKRHEGGEAASTPAADAPTGDADKYKRALERAEAERETAATALRAERVSRLAEREAGAAHALYPDLVALLLEKDLEFEDDSDKPTNLNPLLGALRRRYPLLFRAPSGDGGAGATAAPGTSMNTMIRQLAGRR